MEELRAHNFLKIQEAPAVDDDEVMGAACANSED
jgi:hypothetical protein